MTWFEIEQIARFISELESNLENWTLNNIQMRAKLAELDRISAKLDDMQSRRKHDDPDLGRVFSDLQEHIRYCHQNLRERLIS